MEIRGNKHDLASRPTVFPVHLKVLGVALCTLAPGVRSVFSSVLLVLNPVSSYHCCQCNCTWEELKLTFYCNKAALQSGDGRQAERHTLHCLNRPGRGGHAGRVCVRRAFRTAL